MGEVVPDGGRRERRRRATRAALVAAGRRLLAQKGLDALTVADVAQSADIGFGTFYGYFDTKEALVEAVVDEVLADLGNRNDSLTQDLGDPALVVAVAVRNAIRTALEEPQLASLIVRLGFSNDTRLWQGLYDRMLRDLESGVATGRFDADRLGAAPLVVGGAVMAALRAQDLGLLPEGVDDVDRQLAEALLGALGLSSDEASAMAEKAGDVLAHRTA